MKISLTGVSGFIGQNLSKYLIHNDIQVQMLSLRSNTWRVELDSNANAIIHLAGKAHDTSDTSDLKEYLKVNRDLTIEVFDAFLKSEIKDFFYFSTVKSVADCIDGTLTEDEISNPYTPYGKSKLEAENYILSKELPIGKRIFIIRPCMVHGVGNKGNLNLLYNIIQKGIPWPLASFDNKRSFLGIDNLNYLVYKMLINKDLVGGVYNFADDLPISTNNLVKLISEVSGKKTKLLYINKRLIEKLAVLSGKLNLPLTTERLKKLTDSYVVSNKKIKLALGINKLPFSTEEALIKTIKSFIK